MRLLQEKDIDKIDPTKYFSSYVHVEEMKDENDITYEKFEKDYGNGLQTYMWDSARIGESGTYECRYFKMASAVASSPEELKSLLPFCPCRNCIPPRSYYYTGAPLSILVWILMTALAFRARESVTIVPTISIFLCVGWVLKRNPRAILRTLVDFWYCPCCYGCLRTEHEIFYSQHILIEARKRKAAYLAASVALPITTTVTLPTTVTTTTSTRAALSKNQGDSKGGDFKDGDLKRE